MIPHDCRVVIPPFYMGELRAIAWDQVRKKRASAAMGEDLLQEAIVTFLATATPRELAQPSEANWNRLRPEIQRALTKLAHEDARREESIEDHPGREEELVEPAEVAPTWVPADPVHRRALVAQARKVLKNLSKAKKALGRKTWRVDLMLMGAHVVMSGDFRSRDEAQAAKREVLNRIIDWCEAEDDTEDSGDAAQRFHELHRDGSVRPAIYYGDPLAWLLYMEDFAQNVMRGHRYYVGDVRYELARGA